MLEENRTTEDSTETENLEQEESPYMQDEKPIDQVEDYTVESTSIRSILMRRLPQVFGMTLLYFILRNFDENYVFNPVNNSLFEVVGVFILFYALFAFYAVKRLKETTFHTPDTYLKLKRVNDILDFLSIIPMLMLIVTVLNVFFVSFSPISGTSMDPNFHDDQAVVFSHIGVTYERFDVIIIEEDSLNEPYLIKRIIGLPGETVVIDHNEIYIDGVLLEQDFIDQEVVKTYCILGNSLNYCEFNVPDNSYFVLGDNRDGNAIDQPSGYSVDSRTFGSVDEDNIFGKVILTFKDYNLLNRE